MGKKLTTEDFVKRSIKVHGNRYIYDKVNYINSKIPVLIKCKKHGKFKQIPDHHIRGRGCPKCASEKSKINLKKYNNDEFIKQVIKVHGDRYDYNKVEYKNIRDLIIITCKEHGDFKQKPSLHLKGCGCPKCGLIKNFINLRYSKDEFINQAKQIHGNKYDYSKVNYINGIVKIKIKCPKHGYFWQNPHAHTLQKQGCPKCGIERSVQINHENTLTNNEFINQAKQVHGDKYDYSKVNYINAKTKVSIICKKHGMFEQTPNRHCSKSNGCPKCKESKGERIIYQYLDNNKIIYIRQAKFEGCLSPKNNPLKFDFYLPDYNICVEFDGPQHFGINFFNRSDDNYIKLITLHDGIKNIFCNNHGIKLIRIPYWNNNVRDINNILNNELNITVHKEGIL
jgi:Zn finger protein HypA/HybF involved in hydrogenase expression